MNNTMLFCLHYPAPFFCIDDSKDEGTIKTKFIPRWSTSNNSHGVSGLSQRCVLSIIMNDWQYLSLGDLEQNDCFPQ